MIQHVSPHPPVEVESRDSLCPVIDHVDTLTRWAATFRRLADADPIRCAGLIGAAQHLEREVASAEGAPIAAEAAPGVAPGRVRVDLRTSDRTGR